MESPFLNLHNQLQQKINDEIRQPPPTDELIVFCFTQVRLLHVLYVSMMQLPCLGILRSKANADEFLFAIDKARFDYFSFISVLNQFGRILKSDDKYKKYDINLPLYSRIRFFRNKVVEHWGDYVRNIGAIAITLPEDRPLIPIVVTAISLDERKKLKSEIDTELRTLGLVLDLETPDALNCSGIASNAEKIYSALYNIDPTLCAKNNNKKYLIPDTLVNLLFKFGFPAPILDVKIYSEELVELIISKLNLPVQNPAE